MTYTLWGVPSPHNSRMLKAYATAALGHVTLETKACEFGREQRTDFFLHNASPVGGYPVLQTDDGFIFESNSIVRFLARVSKGEEHLVGRTPYEHSLVDAWLDLEATEVIPAVMPYVYKHMRDVPLPEAAAENVEQVIASIERWLENRTYLVAERLTIADVVIAFALHVFYVFGGDVAEALSGKYKNTYRHYNTVMHQPKIAAELAKHGTTVGVVKSAKKPAAASSSSAAAKDSAAPAAAAAAKKPAKGKDHDDNDDDDDAAAAAKETKKPNPLDALPPSSFVLDEFKRQYSNTDTRTAAAPYFLTHYDPSGYTCFWCRYKYNEENKMQFMTANFVRGWFQRMEHTRKYAFGIALIIGEEKQHDVVGFWVFRGQGMPAIVEDVVDTELFEWQQISDVKAEAAKITDYLCWEGPTIPRPVLEGRCFK